MDIINTLPVPGNIVIAAIPLKLTFEPAASRASEKIREEEACLEVRYAINKFLYEE